MQVFKMVCLNCGYSEHREMESEDELIIFCPNCDQAELVATKDNDDDVD